MSLTPDQEKRKQHFIDTYAAAFLGAKAAADYQNCDAGDYEILLKPVVEDAFFQATEVWKHAEERGAVPGWTRAQTQAP